MKSTIHTPEILADNLRQAGILDVIKSSNSEFFHELPWQNVTEITVGVSLLYDGIVKQALPHIRVHFKKYERPYLDFGVSYTKKGNYEVLPIFGSVERGRTLENNHANMLTYLCLKSIDSLQVDPNDVT